MEQYFDLREIAGNSGDCGGQNQMDLILDSVQSPQPDVPPFSQRFLKQDRYFSDSHHRDGDHRHRQ